MSILSLKKQVFGNDLNDMLTERRQSLNNEIKQKSLDLLKKKKESKKPKDLYLLSPKNVV